MDDNMGDVELPEVAVVAGNGHHAVDAGVETTRVLSHAAGLESARVAPADVLPNGVAGASAYGVTQRTREGNAPMSDGETNGTNRKHNDAPSLFWNSSLSDQEELNWFVPPLPHSEKADAPTEEMLNQFGQMLPQQPKRAWMLKWNYRTRSAATAAEQAHVEQEAQGQFARIKEQAEREIQRIDSDVKRLNATAAGIGAQSASTRKTLLPSPPPARDCTAKCPSLRPLSRPRVPVGAGARQRKRIATLCRGTGRQNQSASGGGRAQ